MVTTATIDGVPVGQVYVVKRIDGRPVVKAPVDLVRPALHGAAPIQLNAGKIRGDIVWLEGVAETSQHPEFGEIMTAWIDMNRLDEAPQMAAIEEAHNARLAEATKQTTQTSRGRRAGQDVVAEMLGFPVTDATRRGVCHYCGLPLRNGECEECV